MSGCCLLRLPRDEHGLRSAERLLGVDHLLGLVQRHQHGGECCGVGECSVVAEEREAAGRVRVREHLRKSWRNRRESTRTGKKKPGRQASHFLPASDKPPPGTIMCRCGWCVMAEPQVWSTAVMPIMAPRCLGSAAMVSVASAAALNNRS